MSVTVYEDIDCDWHCWTGHQNQFVAEAVEVKLRTRNWSCINLVEAESLGCSNLRLCPCCLKIVTLHTQNHHAITGSSCIHLMVLVELNTADVLICRQIVMDCVSVESRMYKSR